jgi:hypothetical protein
VSGGLRGKIDFMDNETKLKSKSIETFTGDMVKVLEGDKGGLIKKIIQEEEQHEVETKNLSPKSKKNKFFMIISIILIILALGALIFIAFFKENPSIVSVDKQFSSMVFTDQTDFKTIDGLNGEKTINAVLKQANSTNVKIGGIDGIYLAENNKVVGLKRFNELIGGNLNSSQLKLFSDNFLIGAFNSGLSSISPNIKDLFFLLKGNSFTDIFPVMRNWESKMLYDLHGFFNINITSDTNYLFTKDFEDGIIANKNARVLKDNNGKIVLMYVFTNDYYVIITNSEEATQEVALRLSSSQIKK